MSDYRAMWSDLGLDLEAHDVKAGLEVAQAFVIGQLREGHRQILVLARKVARARVAAIARHAF